MKSHSIRGASVSVALNMKQVIEIGRLVGLKGFVGNRDYLVLNALFNFEPMERFRTGVMCENFGVLYTARAVEFRMSWRRLS